MLWHHFVLRWDRVEDVVCILVRLHRVETLAVGYYNLEAIADCNTFNRLVRLLIVEIAINVVAWDIELAYNFKVVKTELLGLAINCYFEVAIRCYIINRELIALPFWGVANSVDIDLLAPYGFATAVNN